MTNFRLSAAARIRHDRAECDSDCPACALIDAAQDREPRSGNDFLTTPDFEDR